MPKVVVPGEYGQDWTGHMTVKMKLSPKECSNFILSVKCFGPTREKQQQNVTFPKSQNVENML